MSMVSLIRIETIRYKICSLCHNNPTKNSVDWKAIHLVIVKKIQRTTPEIIDVLLVSMLVFLCTLKLAFRISRLI